MGRHPGQIDKERERRPVWGTRAPAEPGENLAERVGSVLRAPRPGACLCAGAGSRGERVSGRVAGHATAHRLRRSRPTAAGKARQPPSCPEATGERRGSRGADRGAGRPLRRKTLCSRGHRRWSDDGLGCGRAFCPLPLELEEANGRRLEQERARP
ncbi:hypothetical protein NDU88_001930 [Pleurodeles waltl]|uniref:Uncharacterized protein n=1 Tax=Pleurodeles waltl TaxID=8319 RepID=A0AAV7S8S1_PLEWA|nr:hypothetical protein NDU88_001930 [Pleurodeles waltl]